MALVLNTSAFAQIQDSAFLWVSGNSISGMYNADNYYNQFDTPWVYTNLTRVPLFHPKHTWKSFSAIGAYFIAVRGDGTVWAWSTNLNSMRAPVMAQFTSITKTYESLVFGSGTTWAYGITTDGHLYALRNTGVENPIDTIHTFKKISRGSSAFAVLRSDSTIWQYSINVSGQVTNPRELGPGFKYIDMAKDGTKTWGIRTDGTLWRVYTGAPAPFNQEGTANNWVSVASDGRAAFAIQANGTLWAQANTNPHGALGFGNTQGASNMTQVGTDTDWAKVMPGIDHTFGLKTNGALYAWGRNQYSQLGDSTTTMQTAPVMVGAPGEFVGAYAGDYNSVFLRTWGYDGSTSGLSIDNPTPPSLSLQAYPNPATDFIELRRLTSRATLTIYNMAGAEIYQTPVNNPDLRIETQNWPRGQYIVRVTTGNNIQEGKFSLQ